MKNKLIIFYKMSQSEFTKLQKQFKKNPTVNPETGRKIDKNGITYHHLVKKYGSPIKRRSPQRSPRPLKSPRSALQKTTKDPFEVLSEESILRVLQKLNEDNRQLWCSNSQRVKTVCQKYNL